MSLCTVLVVPSGMRTGAEAPVFLAAKAPERSGTSAPTSRRLAVPGSLLQANSGGQNSSLSDAPDVVMRTHQTFDDGTATPTLRSPKRWLCGDLCGDTYGNFRFELCVVNSVALTTEHSEFRYTESTSTRDRDVDHVLTASRGSNRL